MSEEGMGADNGTGGAGGVATHSTSPFDPAATPGARRPDWQQRAARALRTAPLLGLLVGLALGLVLGVAGGLLEGGGATTYTSRTVMLIDDPYRLATAGDDGVLLNLSALRLKYSALVSTDAIAEPVARRLGLSTGEVLSSVKAVVPTESLLMDVDATASAPGLARTLSATTAQQVESYVKTEDLTYGIPSRDRFTFTVIDPASVPSATSPSQAKALTVGVALAVLGFALGFVLMQLLRHRRHLR